MFELPYMDQNTQPSNELLLYEIHPFTQFRVTEHMSDATLCEQLHFLVVVGAGGGLEGCIDHQ